VFCFNLGSRGVPEDAVPSLAVTNVVTVLRWHPLALWGPPRLIEL